MHLLLIPLILLLLGTPPAVAHNPITSSGQDALASGITVLVIILFWLMYIWGAKNAKPNTGKKTLFHITTLITLFTILGPLDAWAEQSATAHMIQHMSMMVLIAPAFALARPLPQYYKAVGKLGKPCLKWVFQLTQHPTHCAIIHGVVIWFWHIPYFYMLAVNNPWIHIIEHACFLMSAIWFWWSCLHAYSRYVSKALLALLVTLMHTGFLGALMTFANAPFYGEARSLEDQQLAGLIMWVVGGIPYIIAAIWVGNRWYRKLERHTL